MRWIHVGEEVSWYSTFVVIGDEYQRSLLDTNTSDRKSRFHIVDPRNDGAGTTNEFIANELSKWRSRGQCWWKNHPIAQYIIKFAWLTKHGNKIEVATTNRIIPVRCEIRYGSIVPWEMLRQYLQLIQEDAYNQVNDVSCTFTEGMVHQSVHRLCQSWWMF